MTPSFLVYILMPSWHGENILNIHAPHKPGKMVLLQKRLVRVITCCHYRAHTEPLMIANQLLSIHEKPICIWYLYVQLCDPEFTSNLRKLFPTKQRCPWSKYSPSNWFFIYHSVDFKFEDLVSIYMNLKCAIHLQRTYIQDINISNELQKETASILNWQKFADNCEPILKVHAYLWYRCLCIYMCM